MWWSEHFGLPPNHELFLAETSTYWKEWFLLEARRKRDRLRAQTQSIADHAVHSAEELDAQRAQVEDGITQINELNSLLKEPEEEIVEAEAQRPVMPKEMEGASVADAKALLAKRKSNQGWQQKFNELSDQMKPSLARE